MAMDQPGSVDEFELAGREHGPLVPVYELVARQIAELAPEGARIVDLGCGPAHHLCHLVKRRPDIRATGLDIAPNMLKLARETVRREGVDEQIELVEGDMTDFAERFAGERVDLVTSVFSLHHLPTQDHLAACLGEIAELRASCGCGVLIFDIARLRHPASWRRFLSGAVPGLLGTPFLEHDSIASEAAAWSCSELSGMLDARGPGSMTHRHSWPFAGFQMHWIAPHGREGRRAGDANWESQPLPLATRADALALRLMFRQF
jgi:SAM-dependent methyltransferase